MSTKNDLYDLIHSLDANEKGYFKKSAQIFSGTDSVYVQMFDVLNKMEDYSEPLFLKKLKNPGILKNLPVLKHQLVDMILKSLRSYHENKRNINEFDALMFESEILRSKGLTDIALKRIAKAKQISRDLDDPVRELQVIDWERRYISENQALNLNTLLKQSFDEAYAAMDRLKIQTKLRQHYLYLYSLVRLNLSQRNVDFIKETERMITDPLIASEEMPPGFYAQLNKLNCWNLYYHIKGDHKNTALYAFKVIELWNKYPIIRDEYLENYLYGLGNYMVSVVMNKNYPEIKKYLDQVEKFKLSTQKVKLVYYEVVTLWKFSYAFISGDEKYLRNLIEFVENTIEEYAPKINPVNTLVIKYGLMRLYFILMDYKKALFVLNDLLNMKKIELRLDIQSNIRLYNMLIHYELGNDEMLEYVSKNSKRYLENNDHYYAYEKIVFSFFNKLIKFDTEYERKNVYNELNKQLNHFIQTNASEVLLFGSTDIQLWLKAKINGQSILDTYREIQLENS